MKLTNCIFKVFAANVLCLAAACSTEVQHGLDERKASEAVVALRKAGIEASKQKEEGTGANGWKVVASQGDAAGASEVLLSSGILAQSGKGFSEVFGKPGLVVSPAHERAMMMQALSGELERTLLAVDGVADARVHVVLPEKDVFGSPAAQAPAASASVLVKFKAVEGKPAISEADIKRLVAFGVEGLKEENVGVVMVPVQGPDGRIEAAAAGPSRFKGVSGAASFLFAGIALVSSCFLVLGARRKKSA